MDRVFLTVLNMSLTGAFVIAAVCLARLPLKKAPKVISYSLWAVAGFRLAVPFSAESALSLIPFNARTIPPDIAAVPRIDSGIPFMNAAVSGMLPSPVSPAGANPLRMWTAVGAYIWLAGAAAMLLYGVVSILLLKRGLRGAVRVRENLYESAGLKTPFVIGLFRPVIYLPAGLSGDELRVILLHEQTHIRRRDPIVRMLAYFLLCLHWFNPLAWAAFRLMGADMEMSCDERVLRELGGESKGDYSRLLVRIAADGRGSLRPRAAFAPLAFGEGGIKGRVRNVLRFRKPPRAAVVAAVALAVVFSAGFALNRISLGAPVEMQMVYEEHPAYIFKEMKLLWGDAVYHVTPMANPGPGREIGYATDEFSTWRIFELRGHSRDYVLAVESEEVWRVMSVHPPKPPWRQYVLEDTEDGRNFLRTRSVTLYDDGRALIEESPLSSFMMTGVQEYTFENGELRIGYWDNSIVRKLVPYAVFEVIDDNTIVFREASIPLRAEPGARYVNIAE